MKRAWLLTLGLLFVVGCNNQTNPNPETIRQDTAKATSTAVRDAKAVAKGVSDGINQNRSVNINSASEINLRTLPGIDEARAKGIISGRPYHDTHELVSRNIVTRAEYDRISGEIVAQ